MKHRSKTRAGGLTTIRRLFFAAWTLPLATFSAQADFLTIDAPGATYTLPAGINSSGQIVGNYATATSDQMGFLFSNGIFQSFSVPGAFLTSASGINDAGQIVGWYLASATGGGMTGGSFLYDGGSFTTFNIPGVSNVQPASIDDQGLIVGSYNSSGRLTGFVGTLAAGFNNYDPFYPFDQGSAVTWVGDAGPSLQTAGWYWDQNFVQHGYASLGAGYATIDFPGATGTIVSGGVSAGPHATGFPIEFVGGYQDATLAEHAFLDLNNVFTTLDPPGSTSAYATGIDSAGQIVGVYTDANGTRHGFLTSANVPEPASWMLLGSGAALIALARSIRRRTTVRPLQGRNPDQSFYPRRETKHESITTTLTAAASSGG